VELSNDTQATLLLCSELGAASGTKVLTPAEYHALAVALHQRNLRPGDLLTSVADDLPDATRLRDLLGRGRLLGLALTKWADFDVWIVSRGDTAYPARLRRLRGAAPPLLFGVGPREMLERGGLAIVGARDASGEALDFTRTVAGRCAGQGVQIVSGGARGVDRTAQEAALEGGGTVLSLPADGLLRAVAERANRLAIRAEKLTLATPFDPEHGFSVPRAMGRNRLIYTLADHALVVQFTTGDGGTWAGAVDCLRHNRNSAAPVPLFVRVTGNPEDGLRQLRDQGALPFPEAEFLAGEVVAVLTRAVAQPAPEQSDLFARDEDGP
jgi:predicted Rossmann fold nucleotide-binding protein DprA/Smf involved in DNA uptake